MAFDDFSFGDLSMLTGGPGGDISGGSELAAPFQDQGGTLVPSQSPGTSFGDMASAVGGGIKAGLQPIADVSKGLLPLAGLGTAAMGLAGGIQGARQSSQQTQIARQNQRLQQEALRGTQAAAAPLTQFGSEQLQAAQGGQIPPAIQAKIDNWMRGAIQKARDFAARSGQGDSSMLAEWEAWIQQQGAAMAADYLQEEARLGIGSLTAGAGALSQTSQGARQGAAQATGQAGGIAKLMEESNRVLASLTAAAA